VGHPAGSYPARARRQIGLLRQISRKAQNKIQDPARLSHLIKTLIDNEAWALLDADVKGDAYEDPTGQGRRRGQVWRPAVPHATCVIRATVMM
jgi:hypothetical protein